MGNDLGILRAPEFLALLRRAWAEPVRKSDVTPDFVPDGYSPDEVWAALTEVRYAQSYRSPKSLDTVKGASRNWHNVTERQYRTLRELERLTCAGSELDDLISAWADGSFITQPYVEEIATNLAYDGYEASYEDVRAVLMGERDAATDAEGIALNFHRIMGDLPRISKGAAFDEATLRAMYGYLVQDSHGGPSVADAPRIPRSPLERHYVHDADEFGCDQPSLTDVVELTRTPRCEPRRHPIMLSMLVNCQFWRTSVLPRCNNLMGCIASRFFLVLEGYPVFRYVPKINILDKWRYGLYGDEACGFEEAIECVDGMMDWTLYYDAFMTLMLKEIRLMRESLAKRAASDRKAIEGIRFVPHLSYRQREVLRQAVLAPERRFFIAQQQKRYQVAYSTARKDLECLADAGYLTRIVEGQAYSYRAARGLVVALSRLPSQ